MSVEEYLQGLPEERRHALSEVREVVLANLPDGYVETCNWEMCIRDRSNWMNGS